MKLCIAIIGPTASGKTAFSINLARKINGEIICMDSTTVYRGFEIGTAKPTPEERSDVAHHGLDLLDPHEPFSAAHFVHYANDMIDEIHGRGRIPVVVGGTYFYLRALQYGMYPSPVIPAEVIDSIESEYFEEENLNTVRMHEELCSQDPQSASAIHPNDRYRLIRALSIIRSTGELPSKLKPDIMSESQKKRIWMKYALCMPRQQIHKNIVGRTEKMLQNGLVNEAEKLQSKYPKARALSSIGYFEACQFLSKKLTEKQLRNEIIEKTRQLAKRQTTWLRSDPEVRYIDSSEVPRVCLEVENMNSILSEPY